VDARYRTLLAHLPGIRCMEPNPAITSNHSYFPVMVENNFPLSRDELYHYLRQHGILVRRYFYPLISDFPMYAHLPSSAPNNLPVAQSIASKVLCLPIYPTLEHKDLSHIADLLFQAGKT